MAEENSEKNEKVFWADQLAEKVLERKKAEFITEGMWSPSGYFHIGNARPEFFTPYAVRTSVQKLIQAKKLKAKVRQNFVIDDFDGIRKIPGNLGIDPKDEQKYLGIPYYLAPSPKPGHKSWSEFFVSDLMKNYQEFFQELTVTSAYETYKKGLLNDQILFVLENPKQIVDVWKRVSGTDREDFIPVQMVCSNCKKILTTKILSWDKAKKLIEYECDFCKNKEKKSPLNGNSKLHWRVHWVAFWIINGVDFESGGKDHFSKGGSVDVGRALIQEVFKKDPPVQIPTEFLQLGKEKMSGSKGNVINLGEWLKFSYPELFRFMYFSYKPSTVIEFDLQEAFLHINERFERAAQFFYGLEECKTDVDEKLKLAFERAMIGSKRNFSSLIPLAFATSIAPLVDSSTKEGKELALDLASKSYPIVKNWKASEKELFFEQLTKAKYWVESYAPASQKISFTEIVAPEVKALLSSKVLALFPVLAEKISKLKDAQEIQDAVFSIAKENSISPGELYKTIYLTLIGKERGPRLGLLVLAIGKEKVVARLKEFN